MRIYAFVFARAGSKRLENKNLLELAGKPLVQHSIDFALGADFIDRVFVSSDSEEILDIASERGAETINRPPELATDESPEIESWRHAVDFVLDRFGNFETFLSLPPTSPLRTERDVKRVVDELRKGPDYCLAVTKSSHNPWFSMVKKNSDGKVETLMGSQVGIQRHQDAPESFDVSAVAFATSPNYIKATKHLWDGIVHGVEVSRDTAVDIDHRIDLELARALINKRL